MKTEVFTCDLCKQSKSRDDLANISVTTRGLTIDPKNKYGSPITYDICKDCLKKKGFIVESRPEDKEDEQMAKANRKTLESKLIDILQDLDVVFHE